jgi:hypothetical protein
MEQRAGFILALSNLINQLRKIKRFAKAANNKECTLEVTIIEGFIELVIPGAYLQIQASTSGSVKFTIGLTYFIDVLQSSPSTLNCLVTPNTLSIGKLSIPVVTTFFETDRILRRINLPVNYTFKDVARLYLSMKYTSEEIQFNNLTEDVEAALAQVETDVKRIAALTKTYGISKDEVEKILLKRLIDTK